MTAKIAIIHTTPVTIDPLKALAAELIPGCAVINLVDDSILPELNANGGNVDAIADRWKQYAAIAEKLGAKCILNACSSIGEIPALVQPDISVPIVRIDQAMAEYAVRSAAVVGVAATLATTLQPTERLLRRTAEEEGRAIRLVPALASEAYGKLLAGDKEGHDRELAALLRKLAGETDIVVLAQASMAWVLERFGEEERKKFISSPRLGMQKAAAALSNHKGDLTDG
ncbi:aspartate/glutamate racemase family protein [Paenibacillus arenilitoris]|uniref:Asp/Glu racemase n=1 Tax=Paenibacillus arenilitoris TaxID=2772299 RepID=A0A927CL41_9BACL|nr:aspartate/glutamate racemase family protein [Paenibacillus arenilitoris]MBD2868792.1 Asp/Glu racemase [Paenibacillus arenilitoris]